MESTRRLAAIMFTDIVGYTAMMGSDENLAIRTVTHHEKVIKKIVSKFEGDLIQFEFEDQLRPHVNDVIDVFNKSGIETILLSLQFYVLTSI